MNYQERPTQEDRILKLLGDHMGKPISALYIVKNSRILQYSARIYGLRQKGFNIKNELKTIKNQHGDDIKMGYFTLHDAFKCEDCGKYINETMQAPFNGFNDYNQCKKCYKENKNNH